MYFHVDESGNTGNNLFDKNQPRLSYGLLSSTRNVDVLCRREFKSIQKIIQNDRIHANELGMNGLVEIAPTLMKIQKKMKFDFDYYFIEKTHYALVIFFDFVFDAGLNEAVKWDSYWTPLRFVLINKLACLFDEDLLKESWRLSTTKRIDEHSEAIVSLLSKLKALVLSSPLDDRSIELISDAFEFGIRNPLALDFGHKDPNMISPNSVAFQFVLSSIARRKRKKKRKTVSSIIVDQQNQFNKYQSGTHYNLLKISEGISKSTEKEKGIYFNHPLYRDFHPNDIIHKGLPSQELTFSSSTNSIGLQIVDVYLWTCNKWLSGQSLPKELSDLLSLFSHRSMIDGISLEGMASRFEEFEKRLPRYEDLTKEQLDFIDKSRESHREKVRSLL